MLSQHRHFDTHLQALHYFHAVEVETDIVPWDRSRTSIRHIILWLYARANRATNYFKELISVYEELLLDPILQGQVANLVPDPFEVYKYSLTLREPGHNGSSELDRVSKLGAQIKYDLSIMETTRRDLKLKIRSMGWIQAMQNAPGGR